MIMVEGLVNHGYCQTQPGVDVYYALFGQGPVKVVLLMGIGTSGLAWKNQIEYFVAQQDYQVLIVDNRGCGRTVTPGGRLTTTEMAQDVVAVLEYLKWNKNKVHLVGNSLGGMIAQELALLIPSQISTLSLINTHAGGWKAYIPPWFAILSISRQFFRKGEREKIRAILETVFSKRHLAKPGRKEYLSIIEQEYPTILDFYVNTFVDQFSTIMPKENAKYLFLQQLTAVLTHRVSTKRLSQLRGRFPIMICVGTGDKIVHPSHSYKLTKCLDAELIKFEGAGHAVTEECLDEINEMLRRHFWKSASCN